MGLDGRSDAVCFFFQAEDGIRDLTVTGVQTCALPIWRGSRQRLLRAAGPRHHHAQRALRGRAAHQRSEEHTSELQSQSNLVCRLLLEKKKKPRALPQSLTPATQLRSRALDCATMSLHT